HVNSGEGSWDSSDTPYEISVMHTVFPLAIRASEILNVDADLRTLWQEIYDNLVESPRLSRRSRSRRAYGAFVYGGEGRIDPLPPEQDLKSRFLGFNRLNSFIDTSGIGGAQIFRNHLRLREGPGAIDAEHIGGLASGIHETMLSSAPEVVDGEPVLRIFNDWPKSWDASFTLLARGAFVVSSAQQDGRIPLVEIRSQAGSQCRLVNPWEDTDVTLYRDGKKAEDLSGSMLTFPTKKGETVVVVPKVSEPARIKIL
ncbi:MAG: hypothetical protein ACETWR_11655, partial [Anaerolineae bacterium]